MVLAPTRHRKRIAVIGAGPAGLAASTELARRGHDVDLFEASDHIGGQFRIAQQIPGKEEFSETLRYYARQVELTGVKLHLNTRADAAMLTNGNYDEHVFASGVVPRIPQIPGINHPMVRDYAEVVLGHAEIGKRVAIVGAGGIGVDVAEFLSHSSSDSRKPELPELKTWMREWGVVDPEEAVSGLGTADPAPSPRELYLLQRKSSKIGEGLAKTTGWVHRAALKAKKVEQLAGVNYDLIDDAGLHISFGEDHEDARILEVDNVVICAGQSSVRDVADELAAAGKSVHIVGGADVAAEIDAKRAIDSATRLAAVL